MRWNLLQTIPIRHFFLRVGRPPHRRTPVLQQRNAALQNTRNIGSHHQLMVITREDLCNCEIKNMEKIQLVARRLSTGSSS